MNSFRVRTARPGDLAELAPMFHDLWPQSSSEEHAHEIHQILAGTAALTMPIALLVAESNDGRLIGFVEVDLRSHADGCDPAQPVGFIEGWYVAEEHRRHGVGKALIAAAEGWARSHKCAEMASDAVIDNHQSHKAHEALGFEVVDRCVHYRKRL